MSTTQQVVARYLAARELSSAAKLPEWARKELEGRLQAIPNYQKSRFLMSILDQVRRGQALSPRQEEVVKDIERRSGITEKVRSARPPQLSVPSTIKGLVETLQDDHTLAVRVENDSVQKAKEALRELAKLRQGQRQQPEEEIRQLENDLKDFVRSPTPKNVKTVGGSAYGFGSAWIEDEADEDAYPERNPPLQLVRDLERDILKLHDHIENKYTAKMIVTALEPLTRNSDVAYDQYRKISDKLFFSRLPYSVAISDSLELIRTWTR